MSMKQEGSDHLQEPAAQVSQEVWSRLYELGTQVRAMEPWLWMEESDVFGVKDPQSGEFLFISVMGLLGEYRAVAVYPGVRSLMQFWHMQRLPAGEEIADMLSTIHHVHAAFGKKSELERAEKQILETLRLKFKGANCWPRFRSFRPGWFPWLADAQEAHWLMLALEQLLDVAPRVQRDRRLLGHGGPDHRYLIRERSDAVTETPWRDTHIPLALPETTLRISVPHSLMNAIRAMPRTELTFELDVAASYTPVGKRGERPQLPFLILAVEPRSEFIIGVELLTVDGTIEEMWAQIPTKFLEMVQRNQIRPAAIAVRTPWVSMVMDGLCRELGIEVRRDPKLQALSRARRNLDRFNR